MANSKADPYRKAIVQHVERVVVQVTVGDGEGSGPIEVREDPERRGLGPRAHQQRTDEADDQIEPDRRREGPRQVRASTQG